MKAAVLPSILALLLCLHSPAQQPTILSPTLARTEGTDPTTSIAFTRLYLNAQTDPPTTAFNLTLPTLTVQCTRRSSGKFGFELFVNYGDVTDTTFYPPSPPKNNFNLLPDRTGKITVTMEFLGYTHVKPVRRDFEFVPQPAGQLRYDSPARSSRNLEEIAFYFQYLRALPTLRLSYPGHTATFLTEPLLAQIRKEPLCRASGL